MEMRQKPQSPRLFGVLNYEMSSQDTSTEVITRLRETANMHRERKVLWNSLRLPRVRTGFLLARGRLASLVAGL